MQVKLTYTSKEGKAFKSNDTMTVLQAEKQYTERLKNDDNILTVALIHFDGWKWVCKKILKQKDVVWCECSKPELGSFAENGQCKCGVEKHHYHCAKCSKIFQIG